MGRAPTVFAHPGALCNVVARLETCLLACDELHQRLPVELDVALDAGELQQRWHKILLLIVTGETETGRHLLRVANDQWHLECDVIDTVMIEPAFVVVQCLAVIAVDHHDCVVEDAEGFQLHEQTLDAGVHVGNGPVILRDNEILVCDARRHP